MIYGSKEAKCLVKQSQETLMFLTGLQSEAVKLSGGAPETVTFVYGNSEGYLVIELYDHSSEAEERFGNDVAFLMHIAAEHKPRIWALLRGAGRSPSSGSDAELFAAFQERFSDYYEVQHRLDANDIPYRREFDSRAQAPRSDRPATADSGLSTFSDPAMDSS